MQPATSNKYAFLVSFASVTTSGVSPYHPLHIYPPLAAGMPPLSLLLIIVTSEMIGAAEQCSCESH